MKGFIVYVDYLTLDEKEYIQLFGRLENGQSFVTLSHFEPYFFIREADLKKVEKLLGKYKVDKKTGIKNFQDEELIKISAGTQAELNKLREAIVKDYPTYEGDIKPYIRFIIDNNLLATINIEGEYETAEKVDRIYREPKITPVDYLPKLKVISLDIEAHSQTKDLFCIGLYGENYKKVFLVSKGISEKADKKKLENAVLCKDEEDCLQKFRDEIIKFDPDIITGWSVIDFDLNYLKERFERNKMKFDIGRTNGNVRLKIGESYFRSSSADIPGRQVLDGLNLIKDPFLQQAPSMRNAKFESYKLEDVAQEILKAGKHIKGHKHYLEIDKSYKENPQKLVDYNLQDCKLVFEILEKTKLIELAVIRSKLTGMPFDKMFASIAAFDSLYIRAARAKGYASPSTHYKQKDERLKGAYVFSLGAGIYRNVLIMDFKSLYPSILRTFNIDPMSHLEKKEKGAIESPNGAYFRNQEGILPEIIGKLHKAREETKKADNELANYAIKTIMNSFWGVLASENCRYFNLEMGNAITSFARMIIQTTAKEIEEKGHKVIYQDTDSNFVETKMEKEKANTLGVELQDYINKFFADYVKKNYNRHSYLELQFDKQYICLMIPNLRQKTEEGEEKVAAKKRYAGLIEKKVDGKMQEELEVTGLEAIRGDWTDAAGEFQKELIMKVFHCEKVEDFIKDYVKKIESGKLDKELVYRKSIRKGLHEYTKTTPPHVKAARQLGAGELKSNIIEYYMTTEGPEPIQKLRHKIDYEHYIEKQIKPIAEQVLSLIGKNFEDVIKSSKQAKLF